MLIAISCNQNKGKKETVVSAELSLDSITAIAKEAYIYGFPMVDNYRVQYEYFQDVYMVVRPNWNGKSPAGINRVINSETELITVIYEAQLFNPADIKRTLCNDPAIVFT
jgi:hypothetical protein